METAASSEISSSVRPPKTRCSKIRAARGRARSRRVRASSSSIDLGGGAVAQKRRDLVERDGDLAAAALVAPARAGVVDEDAAHGVRGGGEELGAILGPQAPLVGEPQVGLVDQRGGAERVTVALAAQPLTREAPEVVVEQPDEAVERVGSALPQGFEVTRDLAGRIAAFRRGGGLMSVCGLERRHEMRRSAVPMHDRREQRSTHRSPPPERSGRAGLALSLLLTASAGAIVLSVTPATGLQR